MLHMQEIILQVCVCASVEKTYYPLYKFSQLLDSVPSLSGWVLIGQKATNSDCGNTIGNFCHSRLIINSCPRKISGVEWW